MSNARVALLCTYKCYGVAAWQVIKMARNRCSTALQLYSNQAPDIADPTDPSLLRTMMQESYLITDRHEPQEKSNDTAAGPSSKLSIDLLSSSSQLFDLTGSVCRDNSSIFAHGDYADIWKGSLGGTPVSIHSSIDDESPPHKHPLYRLPSKKLDCF